MDSFEFNKSAGAVLGTALGVMALSIVSEALFSAGEPAKPGFEVAVAETSGGETAAGGSTAPADVVPIAVRLAKADPAAGQKIASVCLACHTFDKGQAAKVGPNLYGVVGGPAAHMEGFKYSQAMLDERAKGLTWTFENLDHFLTSPKAFVPGTAMGFGGIKKDDQRASVIAFLRTLSDSPVPLPSPDAAAAAPADTAAPPADGNAPAPAATQPAPDQPPAAQPPAGDATTPPPKP